MHCVVTVHRDVTLPSVKSAVDRVTLRSCRNRDLTYTSSSCSDVKLWKSHIVLLLAKWLRVCWLLIDWFYIALFSALEQIRCCDGRALSSQTSCNRGCLIGWELWTWRFRWLWAVFAEIWSRVVDVAVSLTASCGFSGLIRSCGRGCLIDYALCLQRSDQELLTWPSHRLWAVCRDLIKSCWHNRLTDCEFWLQLLGVVDVAVSWIVICSDLTDYKLWLQRGEFAKLCL